MTRRLTLITSVLVILVVVGVRASFTAEQASSQPDVLSELLTEVRGLRTAIERMSSAGARVELAMGRLQLQEQRVDTLARRLDEVRGELRNAERAVAEAERQGKQLQSALATVVDADMRANLEQRIVDIKAQRDYATLEHQRVLAEEAGLAQDLASEQGRWIEINRSLEALERAMGR